MGVAEKTGGCRDGIRSALSAGTGVPPSGNNAP
jgi:hypothetical protein